MLQVQENKVLNPTAYWSRSLCDVEFCYDRPNKECLAVVWALLILGPYLEEPHLLLGQTIMLYDKQLD